MSRLIATATLAAGSTASFATSESFATDFDGLPFGQDAPDLGPLDFLPPGEVQFFANGPYYVPGSNRAWGFEGQGQVNLPFGDWSGGVGSLLADPFNHAQDVTLEVRGSQSGDRNNRTGQEFADSQVGLVWYDENNVRWLGGVTVDGAAGPRGDIDNGAGVQEYVTIGNDGFETIVIDPTAVGAEAVSRVRLVQGTDEPYAYALVGSIAFTTVVPEPGAAVLGLLTAAPAGFARRRG